VRRVRLLAFRDPVGIAVVNKHGIAAAQPDIPWTDLAYSLEPNGRTLDYTIAGPTDDTTPIGVEKQSFVSGLYALGSATGYYSPPGVDPSADLTTQFARVNQGEPDDATADAIAPTIMPSHGLKPNFTYPAAAI